MLVQFNREDDVQISINPEQVAVIFGANDAQPVSAASDDDDDSDTFGEDDGLEDEGSEGEGASGAAAAAPAQPVGNTIIRFRDGRGFKVKGNYETVKAALGAVNMIEFQRDNDKPVSFNPVAVAAVFGSDRNAAISLVRMGDGRGFKVRGPYADTHAKLANAGLLN